MSYIPCKHCHQPVARDEYGQWVHLENGLFRWCNMHDDSEVKAEPAYEVAA